MIKRPKYLTYLAAALFLAAIAMPLQIMLMYGHAPWETGAILAKLTPLNWAIVILAPISGWLVLRASRWMLLALPVLGLVTLYNNWMVSQISDFYSPTFVIAATMAAIGLSFSMIFRQQSLNLIFNPQARWWLRPVRYRASLPISVQITHKIDKEWTDPAVELLDSGNIIQPGVKLEKLKKNELQLKTFDLSSSGAFVEYDGEFPGFRVGNHCIVRLPVQGSEAIECRAEIVRKSESRGNYPTGLAVRFLDLSWLEQRKLKSYLEQTNQSREKSA